MAKFDSRAWQAERGNTALDNPRSKMVIPLERDHLRVGLTRSQVRELLGPPDQERDGSDIYMLGAAPMGIDLEAYVIEYRDDKVIAFGVRRS